MSKRRGSRLYWNRSSVELGCKLPPLSPYLPIYDQGITPGACYLALVKPKIFHIFSLHAHQTCPEVQVTVSCINVFAFIFLTFIFRSLFNIRKSFVLANSLLGLFPFHSVNLHRLPPPPLDPWENDRLTNEWLTTFKALIF